MQSRRQTAIDIALTALVGILTILQMWIADAAIGPLWGGTFDGLSGVAFLVSVGIAYLIRERL